MMAYGVIPTHWNQAVWSFSRRELRKHAIHARNILL